MSYTRIDMPSPLSSFDCSFDSYLKKRKAMLSKHMMGNGLPDYAYKVDYEYRKKLDAVPGLYKAAKALCSTWVSQELQKANIQYLSVGPTQFPEVYDIACDCAKRLGIAVPNVYVSPTGEFNAYAYGYDDVEPFIVITEFMLERLPLNELKAIIGHECGHIQNYHSLYTTLTNLLITAGAQALGPVNQLVAMGVNASVTLLLNMWSRAAEVSADRAGMICADSVEDAMNATKKLLYGGVKIDDKVDTTLDIDSLRKQFEISDNTGARFVELLSTHPATIKRVLTDLEFSECETFYEWRPELKKPDQILRTKEETDKRCKKYIDVIDNKTSKKNKKGAK